MFSQTMYSVNEDAGPAHPVLVLSGPSSTATIVQVTNTDQSATGEYCSTVGPRLSEHLCATSMSKVFR